MKKFKKMTSNQTSRTTINDIIAKASTKLTTTLPTPNFSKNIIIKSKSKIKHEKVRSISSSPHTRSKLSPTNNIQGFLTQFSEK